MKRGIDLSSLTRAERVVGVSGTLLFLNGLVPWWYRVDTGSGRFTYNAGLEGWGVVAVFAAGACALGVLARASIWPTPAPPVDGAAYTALAAICLGTLIVQTAATDVPWIGLWIALVLAPVLLVAAARRFAERRSGWT